MHTQLVADNHTYTSYIRIHTYMMAYVHAQIVVANIELGLYEPLPPPPAIEPP